MPISKALFSSKSDEWETPRDLFEQLDKEFGFNLDPCATEDNHKCPAFFTQNDNGLSKNWGGTACSVIRLIARLRSGYKRHTAKASRRERSSFFYCRQGRTHDTSTNIFSTAPRFAS